MSKRCRDNGRSAQVESVGGRANTFANHATRIKVTQSPFAFVVNKNVARLNIQESNLLCVCVQKVQRTNDRLQLPGQQTVLN